MLRFFSTILIICFSGFASSALALSKTIITDCGNRYLPENSLPAIAIAIAQGAETIQLELAMTGDRAVVVLSDTNLKNITNVSEIFANRARADGTFQVTDFSLEEIKQLSLWTQKTDRGELNSAAKTAGAYIQIPTLAETLGMVTIMEHRLGHQIGVVAEIKKAWLHLHEQLDISREALSLFDQYGFSNRNNLYLASYDPEELRRIHESLIAETGLKVVPIQLLDSNSGQETMRFERGKWQPYNYDWLLTKFGLKALSSFAAIIGFNPDMAIDSSGDLKLERYIEDAHMLGLEVFAYPFDSFGDPLPGFVNDLGKLAEYCLYTAGFDGLITTKSEVISEHLIKIPSDSRSASEKPKTSIELLLEQVKRQKDQQD